MLFVKAESSTSAHSRLTLSCMSKPASAKTTSPGDKLPRKQLLCYTFVTRTASPPFRQETNRSPGCNTYQNIHCVIVLEAGKHLGTRFQTGWFLCENLKTANNHCQSVQRPPQTGEASFCAKCLYLAIQSNVLHTVFGLGSGVQADPI